MPVQLSKPVLTDGDRPARVEPAPGELSGTRHRNPPPPPPTAPVGAEPQPVQHGPAANQHHRGLATRLWTLVATLSLGQQRR